MTGFFVRQSYGYLCSYGSSSSSAPVPFSALSALTTASLPAVVTCSPLKRSPAAAV